MDVNANGLVAGLQECFEDLKDPRVQRNCDHLFIDILSIAILTVMNGAEDWPDIEVIGKHRLSWLRGFLRLPHGILSHDKSWRVFGSLDRKPFAACLFQWTQALHEATGGKVIAIDGKTAPRSFQKKSGLKALHLVTAWATESGLTLGQVACEEKSNEITAIPELLRLLNRKGSTVSIDAMVCQTAIAAQIREQKGHYLLALKGNQSGLQEDTEELADQAIEADFAGQKYDMHLTDETGHGREEKRICCAIEVPPGHPQRLRCTALCTVVIMTCCRIFGGKETWERRLYISSHKCRAKALSQAIRRHWSIENSQHWCLDVTFGEDVRREEDRQGAANPAAVRRLSLSLLRQEKSNKRGIKHKRLCCALSPDYIKALANAQW